MNIKIDSDKCICCGTCYNSFDLVYDCNDDGVAIVKEIPSNDEQLEQAVQGMSFCPVEAIMIDGLDDSSCNCNNCSNKCC